MSNLESALLPSAFCLSKSFRLLPSLDRLVRWRPAPKASRSQLSDTVQCFLPHEQGIPKVGSGKRAAMHFGSRFFFLSFVFLFDLSGGACCLLVPWCQPVYSLVPIHFPEFQTFFGCFLCFSPVFFGFERFCFVLAVFGRVSRDLHTCDH